VINNFYKDETEILLDEELMSNKSKILLSNYLDSMNLDKKILLRPYESIVYIIEK